MKSICVLGANGRLGNMVAKAFHGAGWRVVAVTRNGQAQGLPGDVENRAADALNREALIKACEGVGVIFNGLNLPYKRWKTDCLPMAQNVIAACQTHGSAHLFPGNVYNFGPEIPPRCDESTPENAQTGKGKIRVDMEKLFEQASQRGVKTIVLRAGDYYGGAIKGMWFDLLLTNKLAKGTFTYPGPVDQPHAWAYLPDLAKTFVALAGRIDSLQAFDKFTFPGHTLTGNELRQFCQSAMGTSLKRAGLPWPIIKIGGLVMPMWREISEQSYLWHRPHQLMGDKLEQSIGGMSLTDPEIAISHALADLGLLETREGAAVTAA